MRNIFCCSTWSTLQYFVRCAEKSETHVASGANFCLKFLELTRKKKKSHNFLESKIICEYMIIVAYFILFESITYLYYNTFFFYLLNLELLILREEKYSIRLLTKETFQWDEMNILTYSHLRHFAILYKYLNNTNSLWLVSNRAL